MLIDHVHLVVRDLAANKRFYKAVLAALDVPIDGDEADAMWAGAFYISNLAAAPGGQFSGPIHLAFRAFDHAAVERFHRDAIAAGGTDNGAPGIRARYAADYYAAFVLDPNGNNIEAVARELR
jgi:catechol 2,3-dioxygenase-like lactoylglutathione lyase family enzyme